MLQVLLPTNGSIEYSGVGIWTQIRRLTLISNRVNEVPEVLAPGSGPARYACSGKNSCPMARIGKIRAQSHGP